MRFESKLFLWLTVPFIAFLALYFFWTGGDEPIGVVALLLTVLLFAMVGFYLLQTGRKLPERPEDNARGEISDAEGDYGYFVASSWTPLWLAGAAAILFAGLAIGWWVFAIGVLVGIPALCLWVFESFTGENPI